MANPKAYLAFIFYPVWQNIIPFGAVSCNIISITH